MLDKIVLDILQIEKQILKGPATLAELQATATKIADAADAATTRTGDHRVESQITRTRARAVVLTETFNAMHREADQRTLSRALDAGRA